MKARRVPLRERRSTILDRRTRVLRSKKPRTRPVPHPFLLPNVNERP